MTIRIRLGAIAAVLLTAICGCDHKSPTEPEDSSVMAMPATETYSGSFVMSGSSSHLVAITADGTAEAVLSSLEPLSTLTVGMGIGTADDTGGCTLTTEDITVHVGDTVSMAVSSGTFCVSVFDVGNIPSVVVVDYEVELHVPSTPIEIEKFTGEFGMGERSCHSVTAARDGSLKMTMRDLQPLTTLAVGMGVGTPDGAGECQLFAEDHDVGLGDVLLADEIVRGPYCVCVFDVGNVFEGERVTYDVRVEHP